MHPGSESRDRPQCQYIKFGLTINVLKKADELNETSKHRTIVVTTTRRVVR